MLNLKIIGTKELGLPSTPIDDDEFGEELDEFMSEMSKTMYANNGVGISGVQVGRQKNILIAEVGYVRTGVYGSGALKMVNPEIIEQSDTISKAKEGCLSYPGLELHVERPDWIVVKYKTPLGEEKTERFEGFEARIILHEMDHFKGVTLYSRMSRFKRSRYNNKLVKNLKKLSKSLKNRAERR